MSLTQPSEAHPVKWGVLFPTGINKIDENSYSRNILHGSFLTGWGVFRLARTWAHQNTESIPETSVDSSDPALAGRRARGPPITRETARAYTSRESCEEVK